MKRKGALQKINIGCFNSNIEGWIGIDHALRHILLAKVPFLAGLLHQINIIDEKQYHWHKERLFKNVRYGDATKTLRFGSDSVDFIYSSHMLEHLYRDDAVFFIGECYRVLKRGGLLRICIPSWELCRIQDGFDRSKFAKNKKGLRISHKWLWAAEELQQTLKEAGFCHISTHQFQQGDFPDLDKIEKGRGLIIQAQK